MKFAKKMVAISFLVLVSVAMAACSSTPAASPKPAESGAKPSAQTPAISEALKKVIDAARQEKEAVFQIKGGTLPEQEMRRRLQDLVKKYFNIDLSIITDGSLPYTQVPPKLLAEAKSGAPPTYDLIYQVDNTIAPLYAADMLEKVDWAGLTDWIKKEDVFHEGKALIIGTLSSAPAYNTKLVSKADLPKKWVDLGDPKWKGKMISTSYQTPLVRLAQADVLGEAKALDLVNRLATQQMAFGRYPDIHTRLSAGEFSLASTQISQFIVTGQREGAPVAEVPLDDPVVIMPDVVAVPKQVKHPNAARLVAAVLLTEDGQSLLWEAYGVSSLLRPNTPISEWAKGKKLSFPDMNFLIPNMDRIDKQYSDILLKK